MAAEGGTYLVSFQQFKVGCNFGDVVKKCNDIRGIFWKGDLYEPEKRIKNETGGSRAS